MCTGWHGTPDTVRTLYYLRPHPSLRPFPSSPVERLLNPFIHGISTPVVIEISRTNMFFHARDRSIRKLCLIVRSDFVLAFLSKLPPSRLFSKLIHLGKGDDFFLLEMAHRCYFLSYLRTSFDNNSPTCLAFFI